MTLFFRRLAQVNVADVNKIDDHSLVAPLAEAYYIPEALGEKHRQDTAERRPTGPGTLRR